MYIKAPDELNLDIEKEELGLMAVGYYAILESAFRASLKKNIDTKIIENLSSLNQLKTTKQLAISLK